MFGTNCDGSSTVQPKYSRNHWEPSVYGQHNTQDSTEEKKTKLCISWLSTMKIANGCIRSINKFDCSNENNSKSIKRSKKKPAELWDSKVNKIKFSIGNLEFYTLAYYGKVKSVGMKPQQKLSIWQFLDKKQIHEIYFELHGLSGASEKSY